MKFSEIVDQASALLQRKQQITYRTLKREFVLAEPQDRPHQARLEAPKCPPVRA